MKLNETVKVLKPYTKEEIEEVVEVIFGNKSGDIISDVPEWLLPQLQKELIKVYKDRPIQCSLKK